MTRHPNTKPRRSSPEVKAFIAGGPEPKVNIHDLAMRSVDGPEEKAVLILAEAIRNAEHPDDIITWKMMVRAADYYNANGLARTLDECERLSPDILS